MLLDELRSYLLTHAPEQRLTHVRIGLSYTAVMLEDGQVGVSWTSRESAAGGCSLFLGRRPLAGRTTTEILEFLDSSQGVESTVGMAVTNAMANRLSPEQKEGDILDLLPLRPNDHVGMVGYFGPLVTPLERQVSELTIFERNITRSERVLPAEDALEYLPQCDVAIITSTSLILSDSERLLKAAAGCREVALVGASTPLIPAVFKSRGVTLLSGIVVTDGPGILQIVSEGGGMGFFSGRIRKVNIKL